MYYYDTVGPGHSRGPARGGRGNFRAQPWMRIPTMAHQPEAGPNQLRECFAVN